MLIPNLNNRTSQFRNPLNTVLKELNENVNLNAHIYPKVNILESKDAYMIAFLAPGFKKQNFTLKINENILTISATLDPKKNEDKPNDTAEKETLHQKPALKYLQQEFSQKNFSRSFKLALSIDQEKIEAKYEDGILTVTLPKREEAKEKPPRTISVL